MYVVHPLRLKLHAFLWPNGRERERRSIRQVADNLCMYLVVDAAAVSLGVLRDSFHPDAVHEDGRGQEAGPTAGCNIEVAAAHFLSCQQTEKKRSVEIHEAREGEHFFFGQNSKSQSCRGKFNTKKWVETKAKGPKSHEHPPR